MAIQSTMNRFYLTIAFLAGIAIPLSTSLQNITITLICIVAVFDPEIRKHIKPLLKNYFVIFCILLYIIVLLWALKSQAPTQDIKHMIMKMRIFLLCPLILAYFVKVQHRIYGCLGFASGAIVTVILSIFAFSTKIHLLNSGINAWSGPFGDWAIFRYHTYHNYFIAVMVTALVSILLYYRQALNRATKVILYIIIIVSSIDVLYLVQGRAGQILFIIMLGLVFLLWNFKKGMILTLIFGVMTCIIIYTSPAIHSGFNRATEDINQYDAGNARSSVGARIEFVKYSKELIKLAPITGYGTGSFHYEYQKYTKFTGDAATRHPHNDFYWLWVELGILGPLLLILIICSACYYGIRQRTPDGRLAAIIVISYMIGAIQGGFFTDNISGSAFMIIIAILLMGQTLNQIIKPQK